MLGTLALAGLAAYVGFQIFKPKKKKKKTTTTTTGDDGQQPQDAEDDAAIIWGPDCASWEMPEAWATLVAEARWQDALDYLEGLDVPDDFGEAWILNLSPEQLRDMLDAGDPEPFLIAATYYILAGSLPPECPVPLREYLAPGQDPEVITFRDMQTSVSGMPDYWGHPEAILGLYSHIFEAASFGLENYIEGDDREDALLFPPL